MSASFGEIAWRERRAEWAALQTIKGAASNLDILRNNELPIEWEVTDKGEKKLKISAGYIMSKARLKDCAKWLKLDLESIHDLTGEEAAKFYSSYPQWLYEICGKKALFHLMDDMQLDEVRRVTEIAITQQIMLNKFRRQWDTGKQSFVGGDKMFLLVLQVLIENAIIGAAAKGSNATVTDRLTPLIELCEDTTLSDAEFRTRMLGELKEIKARLHKDLPAVFRGELEEWAKRLLHPSTDETLRKLMSEEEQEDEDE